MCPLMCVLILLRVFIQPFSTRVMMVMFTEFKIVIMNMSAVA